MTVEQANPLLFGTSNAERMRIDSSGNVLLGTTTADNKLTVSVSSSGAAAGVLSLVNPNDATSTAADLEFVTHSSGTLATGRIRTLVAGADDYPMSFWTYGSSGIAERMRIDNSGNVGVGTSSPAYPLHVNGRISYSGAIGEGADTTLSSTGTTIIHGESATWTVQRFYTGGTERMRITSSGNVGIATSSPIQKLDVSTGGIASTDTSGNARSRFEVFTNGQTNNQVTLGQGFAGPTDNVGYLYNRANAAFVFGTNNTERMRITNGGNVLVGTTTTAGSVSNSAELVSGKFISIQGTQVGASGTFTTVVTLPSLPFATYMVSGGLAGAGDTTNYHNVAIVCTQSSSTKITNLVTSGLFSISLSGLNVQMAQSSGLAQNITYCITRIA